MPSVGIDDRQQFRFRFIPHRLNGFAWFEAAHRQRVIQILLLRLSDLFQNDRYWFTEPVHTFSESPHGTFCHLSTQGKVLTELEAVGLSR